MNGPESVIDLKAWCPLSFFTWNTITIMGIQDKNTKNNIKSKNYPKIKTLRELEEFDINQLVYCYKTKRTVWWAEEHTRRDVCKLNSKLASKTDTQIQSS